MNSVSPKPVCKWLLTFCALTVVSGCGAAPETDATFSAGDGDNPIDGAVIADDGKEFSFETNEGGSLKEVNISADGSTSAARLEFTDNADPSETPAVRVIETEDGDTVEFDSTAGFARATVNVPFVGETTISLPLEDIESALGDTGTTIFDLGSRTITQSDESECAQLRDSIDTFCRTDLGDFDARLIAEKDAVKAVAAQELEAIDLGFLVGTVNTIIDQFYESPQDTCDAWTEMRTGTETVAAVDPCS